MPPISPADLPPSVRLEQSAGLVMGLCVSAIFVAVFLNFAAAGRAGAVRGERRSVVATGSMTAFFVVVWLLIERRVGVVAVAYPTQAALTAAGLALTVLGLAVNLKGRWDLGRNWANQATVYEAQTLVDRGVFGWVRHPLYASLFAMFYGSALVYRNVAVAAATSLIFVPAMWYRARQEEVLLAAHLPDYDAYRRRVGMFLPRWRGGRTDDGQQAGGRSA